MINGSFDASKYVFNARNPHFKRALELRRDGKYKEAGKELTIAADVDGDLEALIMQYEALVNGGFGIKCVMNFGTLSKIGKKDFLRCKDLRHVLVDYYGKDDLFVSALLNWDDRERVLESEQMLNDSFKNGNTLAIFFLAKFFWCNVFLEHVPFIKLGAELGDATCCFYMLQIVGSSVQSYVQCGLKQFYTSIGDYWDLHRSHVLSRKDWIWFLVHFDKSSYIERATNYNLSQKEMYQFGKWVCKRYFPSLETSPFNTKSWPWDLYANAFHSVNTQCQQSVLCFLFYFKPILGKDVTKLIAQQIWKSRKEEPEIWVKEEEEGVEKRQKK